jgi:hypothetical protein
MHGRGASDGEPLPLEGESNTSLLHALNEGIALVAADLTQSNPSESKWNFRCECGDGRCDEWVELELSAYTELRSRPEETILAPGHAVDRVRRARTRAAALREDASALKAQASQVVRQAAMRAERLERPGVTRYRYELHRDGQLIATGRISRMAPLEVADEIELAGHAGIVRAITAAGTEPVQLIVVDAS